MVGQLYFQVGDMLQLDWLRAQAPQIVLDSHWDKLALDGIMTELFDQQRRLTVSVINSQCDGSRCRPNAVERWHEENAKDIERFLNLVWDLQSVQLRDISMLMVALRQLGAVRAMG
jgi:glutamate dehydrogenase